MEHNNFKVTLDVKTNSNNEIEVNSYNRRSLINSNFLGKFYFIKGLNYYEVVCSPREIVSLPENFFSMNKIQHIIKDVLRCNICLEIYQEPVNIKNCLH